MTENKPPIPANDHDGGPTTPAEEAAFDLLAERADLPPTAKLWTFGSSVHADTDGWSAEGAAATANRGHVTLAPSAETIVLRSPERLYIRPCKNV